MDTDTNNPAPPIETIPLEILLRITSLLTTPELGNFRLSCRSVEQALHRTFTQEFFTRKQFMMDDFSLQALVDISRSRMGSHMRFLHIGLDFHHDTLYGGVDGDQEESFRQRYSDQFTLSHTGHRREMLEEAFRNLRHLECIVIRNYNSARRNRDGGDGEWKSYGAPTAIAETGQPLVHSFTRQTYSSEIFAAVIYALGRAGSRVKGIEVMMRRRDQLRDFAFNVPRFIEPVVLPVLRGLEKLHLTIDLSWNVLGDFRGVSMEHPPAPTSKVAADTMLRKFLLKTSSLRDLRINGLFQKVPAVGRMIEWLGRSSRREPDPTGLDPLPSPGFPLEKLSLGLLHLEAPVILALVRKFAPTLKHLELWKVNLVRIVPNAELGTSPRVSFWTEFLEELKDIPDLNLDHIKVGMAQQLYANNQWSVTPWMYENKYKVSFGTAGHTLEYTGADWRHFIAEDVIPSVWVDYGTDVADPAE